MGSHRPVASVTGSQDWEWNRWQAAVRSSDASTGMSDRRPSTHRESSPRERIDVLERKITELEMELERKDRRLQSIIDHYERIVRAKNRELAACETHHRRNETDSIVSKLLRR